VYETEIEVVELLAGAFPDDVGATVSTSVVASADTGAASTLPVLSTATV